MNDNESKRIKKKNIKPDGKRFSFSPQNKYKKDVVKIEKEMKNPSSKDNNQAEVNRFQDKYE